MPAPAGVLRFIEENFSQTLDALVELARIPGVSADGFDPFEVERSAEAVAVKVREAGLEGVEVLRVAGAHPYVVGEWLHAGPDAKTVLLYAHHDVQPPGRLDYWETPPFEPCVRDDGRLYGRGVVDDKAGIFVHLAAIRAFLETTKSLPLNVKVVIEGEEEIGSGHLAEFLAAHRERLAADVIVLSDTANLATGLPSLTTSLRGLVVVDINVRALDHPVHSGMWGGPVLDAATALAQVLARLADETGRIKVPRLEADVPEVSPADRERLDALPFDERAFREDAGMWKDARFWGSPNESVYERLWLRPAIAVTALEAMPLADAANQLIAVARARVGLRLAPGQDARRARDCLMEELQRDPPAGVEVAVSCGTATGGWRTEPEGPVFEAARRALSKGYGRDPVAIGCGGTIPFVAPFAKELGGVPALLLGVEDPACNAHGENESLDIEDFRKAIDSTAHLFSELAAVELYG